MIFDGSSYYWKSDKNFRLAVRLPLLLITTILTTHRYKQLYNSNDGHHPIATYAPASPVTIVVLAERETLLAHAPEVLAAFIIQESKMRQGEKFREVATGMGQMDASAAGYAYSSPSGNMM